MTDQKHARGTLLHHGHFRVEKWLGSGGFGEAYLVIDQTLNVPRALKELKSSMPSRQLAQQVIQRFHREVHTLQGLDHRLIPRVYGSFSENSRHYMVQEWIDGETLEAKVAREGKQSEAMVKAILNDLLEVISYIHSQDIIHRDIKPDNIILRHSNGEPVLIDFGIVKEISRTEAGQTQISPTQSIGTPGYQAIEQFRGWPERSSDLYSLGKTAVFLLTGYNPTQLEQETGLYWHPYTFSDVSQRFKQFIDRAIQEHKGSRFATAEEMLRGLHSLTSSAQSNWAANDMGTQAHTRRVSPAPEDRTAIAQLPVDSSTPGRGLGFYISLLLGSGVGLLALMVLGIIPGWEQLPMPQAWRAQVEALLNRQQPVATEPVNQPVPTVSPAVPSPTPTITTSPPSPPPPAPSPAPIATSGRVIGTPGYKRIRSGPGTDYAEAGRVWVGETVEVTDRAQDSGDYEWYKVITADGQEGWMASQLLELEPPLQPTTEATSPPGELPENESIEDDTPEVDNVPSNAPTEPSAPSNAPTEPSEAAPTLPDTAP